MFLHAERLRVTHPATGQVLELHAPLPEALERAVDALAAPGA
jgi:23S rRNA pseudouridine955/2504/2580 synthase